MKLFESDAVEAFDARVDAKLERWRGNPVADRVFAGASKVGDFSLIWHLIGVIRALVTDGSAKQALVLSALIGTESLVVNQGVKRLFRRVRPTTEGDPRFDVRKPLTSSFPSGHASSAFFAATILTSYSGLATAPIWFTIAALIGISRVYVRIHHASDVVGGAIVGLALGQGALALLRAIG